MIAGGLEPQAAVDWPQFCILDGAQHGIVALEDGYTEEVLEDLQRRDHKMRSGVSGYERSTFGRVQIIKRDRTTGVLWAGLNGRADGCAMGFKVTACCYNTAPYAILNNTKLISLLACHCLSIAILLLLFTYLGIRLFLSNHCTTRKNQ
jgi:hypothetical protein